MTKNQTRGSPQLAPLDIFPVIETKGTPNNTVRSDNVLETQNTDLIEKLVMEGQQNEGEEYEDHYDNLTKTTPYSGKKNCAHFMKMVVL